MIGALFMLYLAEEAKRHADSIDELKKRWENIQRKLLDIRNTMNLLEDKENFQRNVEALQSELDDTSAWCERAQAERLGGNLLIHVRNRLRGLRQLRARLAELRAQAIVLRDKPLPAPHKQGVEDAARRVAEQYDALLQQLSQREADIKQAISKKPADSAEDEFKLLQSTVQAMEAQVIAEHAVTAERDVMQSKLAALAALQRQFGELQGTYERVVRERRSCARGSVQELDFRSSVENLVTKFEDTRTILQQKIDKLENGRLVSVPRVCAGVCACADWCVCAGLQLTQRLADDSAALARWLDAVELWLSEHSAVPLGEQDQLERLLDASNVSLKDSF